MAHQDIHIALTEIYGFKKDEEGNWLQPIPAGKYRMKVQGVNCVIAIDDKGNCKYADKSA